MPHMHVVLGATGHVGSAVAHALLDRGEPVTVVTRDAAHGAPFAERGARVAALDIHDVPALRDLLASATRAFLLMPPADPAGDSLAEEQRSVDAIARALEGTGLEKAVVQSTYGARAGDMRGDFGVLHELETRTRAAGVRTSVVRGAYYMSNWDPSLEPARASGELHSPFPDDLAIPMVAPADLGRVAARLLTDDLAHEGVVHVEGPRAYSAADVARAFTAALGRPVRPVATPREGWEAMFGALGFSPASARSYARMTAAVVDGEVERPAAPERGPTTLEGYVKALAARR